MMAWGAEVTPEAQAAAAHTPRPANAFILYRAQHHRAMVASHPGTPNTMICKSSSVAECFRIFPKDIADTCTAKMIGKMWSQESEEVRQDFKRQAEIVKGAHMAKNPDYQYKPRKPAEKKRRMTKRKAARLVALQQVYGDNAGFPATSPLSMASSSPATPADTAALSPFIADSAVPLLEPAGIDSTFLFDSAAPDQIKLFEEMLLNHLSSMEEPGSVDTQPPVISSELTNVGKAQWLNDMVIDGVNAIGGGSQSFATFGNQFKQQTDLGTPDELTAQAMTDEALDSVGNWQMADVFDYALLYGNEAFAAPVGESETK